MSSSSEVRFEFPEVVVPRAPGPLEKLWQASAFGTAFLSEDEVQRRELEARALGIEETERRLRAQHERESGELRATVFEALSGFARDRQRYFDRMEKEVVRLAVAVARKVVGRELREDPAMLAGAVRQVLQRLEHDGKIRLRVSPGEVAAWEKAMPLRTNEFVLLADESLEGARCVLETPVGVTVLDPFAELEEIESVFMQAAPSSRTENGTTIQ